MSFLSSFFSKATANPIKAVFDGIDSLVTNDEERAAAALLKIRAMQEPDKLQVELNKIEAQHRSVFVSGWRPFIGWVCGIGLVFFFLINPIVQWTTGETGPSLPMDYVINLVYALLGLGSLRTVEKLNGRTK